MSKLIIAIMGPSGSGKDTILNSVLEETNTTKRIISCTTRPKRENEIEGKDYYFLSREDFIKIMEEDRFLTCTCFNGWFYGILEDTLSEDKVNVGVFTPSDIQIINESICNENKDIALDVFYVEATDKNRLMRQLLREDSPNIEEIIRRYTTDKKDFQFYNLDFDYITIENNTTDDFDKAVQTIIDVNSL